MQISDFIKESLRNPCIIDIFGEEIKCSKIKVQARVDDKQGPLCVPNHMYRHSDIHSKLPLKYECSTPKTREHISI